MIIIEQIRSYNVKMEEIEQLEYAEALAVNQLRLKRKNTVIYETCVLLQIDFDLMRSQQFGQNIKYHTVVQTCAWMSKSLIVNVLTYHTLIGTTVKEKIVMCLL